MCGCRRRSEGLTIGGALVSPSGVHGPDVSWVARTVGAYALPG